MRWCVHWLWWKIVLICLEISETFLLLSAFQESKTAGFTDSNIGWIYIYCQRWEYWRTYWLCRLCSNQYFLLAACRVTDTNSVEKYISITTVKGIVEGVRLSSDRSPAQISYPDRDAFVWRDGFFRLTPGQKHVQNNVSLRLRLFKYFATRMINYHLNIWSQEML